MRIVAKGVMLDGTKIQVEDWSEEYPNVFKKATSIGFYPMCKTSINRDDKLHFPPYPERGRTFRSSFKFENSTETMDAFLAMLTGEKNYLDYMDYYDNYVIAKEDFLRAVA